MMALTDQRCQFCQGNLFIEHYPLAKTPEIFCLLCARSPQTGGMTPSERHVADLLAWDRLAMKERLS